MSVNVDFNCFSDFNQSIKEEIKDYTHFGT